MRRINDWLVGRTAIFNWLIVYLLSTITADAVEPWSEDLAITVSGLGVTTIAAAVVVSLWRRVAYRRRINRIDLDPYR